MKKFQQEDGFTLIEMLIVLLIISVLILITVPNVGKHFKTIDEKGCDAYISKIYMKSNYLQTLIYRHKKKNRCYQQRFYDYTKIPVKVFYVIILNDIYLIFK